MLEDLRIPRRYDGLLYRADPRFLPRLASHRHAELELNVVESGSITYVVEGRRVTLPPRTLLWLFPEQEHQRVGSDGDARHWVAAFKPAMVRRACRDASSRRLLAGSPPPGPPVLHTQLGPDAFERVRLACEELARTGLPEEELSREAGFGGGDSGFRFEHPEPDWLNAGLRALLLRCWRLQRGRGGDPAGGVSLHPAVRRTLDRLGEPFADDGRAALARHAGVSPAHLSRLFAAQVGQSLTAYRTAIRLRRFRDAYKNRPDAGLTAAAYVAGFGSYAQFYKSFVAAYGQSPQAAMGA